MTTTEIILIIIGLVLLLGSFFIKDVLSPKDVEKIAQLSEEEIAKIIEAKMKQANDKIEESIDSTFDEAEENSKRNMEKATNEKIMAISEFSDTVLDSMNKTHNEIMFLYSMLNDKHGELTELAGDLNKFSSTMKETENEILGHLADAAEEMKEKALAIEEISEAEVEEALTEETEAGAPEKRSNEEILKLHREGKSDVEIAKTLGRGLGEVKLVLGLYQKEETSEV